MANELGGRNDKYGNRYEHNCIIDTIIDVVAEKITSFSFEPLGEDEQATDILIIENDGSKKFVQCKERNGNSNSWNFEGLNRYHLLFKWKTHLDRAENNIVALRSPLPFIELEDLAKRARNTNENPLDFYKYQIENSSMKTSFNEYCKSLRLDYTDESNLSQVINYLRRTKVEIRADEDLKNLLIDKIKLYFIGNCDEIYNIFLDWIINGDIMGNTIDNLLLDKFFKEKNIILRDLSNDESNFSVLKKLNQDYKNAFIPINGEIIQRNVLQECIDKITIGDSIIIHGKAGYGKSGITTALINYLEKNDILYLAIKLDKKTPSNNVESWSKELGFSLSISYCLSAFSREKNCVLILDQLDALRWTQSHTKDASDVCRNLVEEINRINIEREKNISVVLVSRTFDLENDNNINRIVNKDWTKIRIDLLNENDVKNLVGDSYDSFNNRLKTLLRIPSNLFIWTKLKLDFNVNEIHSTGSLIEKWWENIEQDGRNSGFESNNLLSARNTILEAMKKTHQISIPTIFLDVDSTILDFLCSKEFIIKCNNSISFSHQSIFDYYSVKKMINEYYNGTEIVKLLGSKDTQSPIVRYQLQMFLEELYYYDTLKFKEAIEYIINCRDIRSYIKYVVYEVLGLVSELDSILEQFILEYIEKNDYFDTFINDVFMGHEIFIDMLIKNKIFDNWFKNLDKRNIVITLIRSINDNLSNEVVKFIKNNLFINKETDLLLYQCFPYDIRSDSDELFDLRLKIYTKYIEVSDIYVNLDELIKSNEIRAINLVEFWLKSTFKKKKKLKYSYDNSIEFSDETKVSGDIEIISKLLPLIPKYYSESFEMHSWIDENYNERNIERIVISLLKNATVNLINRDKAQFWTVFEKYLNKGLIIHNEIILYGLLNMTVSESNKILLYLFSNIDKNIFEYTSGSEESISLTKQILSKFIVNLEYDEYLMVESAILNYKPSDMIERCKRKIQILKERGYYPFYLSFWGDLQFELLRVIPENLLTRKAKNLLHVLNRKFNTGKSHKFDNHYMEVCNVISPISNKKISDKSWVKILSNSKIIDLKKSKELVQESTFVESNLYEFQSSFSVNVQDDPERFINLVVKNKKVILQPFIDTLFSSLAYSNKVNEISIGLLENMFFELSYKDSVVRASCICEIISRKSDVSWSNNTIDLLKSIFNDIKNNIIPIESIIGKDNDMDKAEKWETYIINTPVGKFALAFAHLLWERKELLLEFKEIIQFMIDSDDKCIKYSVLYILNPCLNIDKNWAIENIVNLFKDSKNMGFRNARNMLFFCYSNTEKYRKEIVNITMTAISIDSKHIKTMFAWLVVDLYVNFDEFHSYIDVLPNDEVILKGLLDMFIAYLEVEEKKEMVKPIIIRMLELENINFNSYRIFNSKRINLEKDKEFLLQICMKKNAKKTVGAFVNYVNKEAISLLDYKEFIFELADGCIDNYSSDNYDLSLDLEDLVGLIVKIFDEVYEDKNEIKNIKKCLDLWDKMFENHIGSIRKISKDISNL